MKPIYIPTRGRINSQHTYDLLCNAGLNPLLVCPPEEENLHRAFARNCLPRPVSGIANVRQWIVEQHHESLGEEIIMCDDDLGFFVRADPDAWNLKPADPGEIAGIFERLRRLVGEDEYAHAGITPRQMNNVHFPQTTIKIGKMNAVHCVHKKTLVKENIKYNDVELMEDYYVTLSLLKRGYVNVLISDAAWDQKGVSGAAGGCSLTRTPEKQAEGARRLSSLFPQTVKVVEKTPKGAWGDGQKTRTDVRIQWVKTYNLGMSNK